jgi:parallel beta-helix repeat protein
LAEAGDTLVLEDRVHDGPIVINKPLTLVGAGSAEIRGTGKGNTVHISADHVTLQELRITGSGLNLFDDDAAVFVTGDNAIIADNEISNSLHGIYLKKVRNARVTGNRIEGKTTLAVSNETVEKGIGQSAANCDTTLLSNRRGNGIHQWNCQERNQRSARRHLLFLYQRLARREQLDPSRSIRPALHVFERQRFREQHLHGKRGRGRDHVLQWTDGAE